MNLATLGTRGTDIVVAGLKLPHRFNRAELVEIYGKLRRDRDGTLPQHWQQGISNELQRLGSDFSRFHKEHRRLDLIAHLGSGQYCFRDEIRPKLIDAANQHADLLVTQNTLVVPTAANEVASGSVNHLIGAYAQQKIMMAMRGRGFKILQDTSTGRSYDFTFCGSNRYDTPQIMECKGSRRADVDVALTANELSVMLRNPFSYWVGVVYSIDLVDGIAVGGTDPFITPPPVLDKWHFAQAVRLRRISEASNLLFDRIAP